VRHAGVAVALVALLAACGGGDTTAERPRSTTSTTSTTSATVPPSTTTAPAAAADPCSVPTVDVGGPAGESPFVTGADFATALAWAPDGRLFFAEREGTIKIARGDTVTEFAQVPTAIGVGYSERGLLGLALSPAFASDHYVYAMYTREDLATEVVVRFTDCAGEARDHTTLVTLPSGRDCCHKGGRLAFGPDGKLYVTVGDEHAVDPSTVGSPSSIPQDPADPRGKVLRYEPDGTIPADNPFGPASPAWVTGLRNPFGLAFAPDGTAFVTVNGPTGEIGTPATGFDLAFRVEAGGQYQWPACYGYSHLTPGASSCLGRPEPEWSSEDVTVVPTGATWVDHRGPSAYAGHFVFCSQSGLRVFVPGSPHATVASGPGPCMFDVEQGPDGALYYSDTTTIYRLG
jgi:glucose/arabinose dehydrogenase